MAARRKPHCHATLRERRITTVPADPGRSGRVCTLRAAGVQNAGPLASAGHVPLTRWGRIADLVDRYADLPLGGTDASVIALAERLDASVVITLDRRHFTAVRSRHREAFELLPDA